MAFPDYPVVAMDSQVERVIYERMGPSDWILQYPRAVIDEAQKLPSVFDAVKASYDRNTDARYLLLDSSQILLLKKVRETLAGRMAVRELYPFVLPELVAMVGGSQPHSSRLLHLIQSVRPSEAMHDLFPPNLALGEEEVAP